ncbi:MAG TPA: WHG domain-containing protein [Roseiarcus sp.]|jgi:AcrR family transcriptional regulator|nr:WHG domain-containing protein [Roseiarcus sp.]
MGKAKNAYHHGDLRAALIAAARQVLETTRPEEITLKSLALRLGVSQPAPYRHFANRDALLAAVAADGFERFRDTLVAAQDEARENEVFLQSCLAYLEFARTNRGVYRLMFASQLLREADDAALDRAASAAFDFLLEGVARTAPPERVRAIAVWIWSTLHGLAMLEAEGLAGGPASADVSPADVVRQMMATLAGRGG